MYLQHDSRVAAGATEVVAERHQDPAVHGEQDVLGRVGFLRRGGVLQHSYPSCHPSLVSHMCIICHSKVSITLLKL